MRPLFEVYITRLFLTKALEKSEDETVIDFQQQFLLKFTNAQFFIEGFSDSQQFDNFLFEHGLSTNEGFNTARLSDFTAEFSNNNFFKSGSAHKLFLLESENAKEYEDRYGYLFITHDNLSTKWVPHRIDSETEFSVDNEQPLPKFESQQFKNWSQLFCNHRAGNSIVLFDKYILKNRKTYQQNIAGLLKAIGQNCRVNEMQVLIITENIDKKTFRQLSENEIKKSEVELSTTLNRSGIKNAKVTCILYPMIGHFPGLYQKNAEHDRFVFTNYLYLESGAGFVLFNSRNAFQYRTTIRVNSLLNRRKIGIVYSAIRSIAYYVNSVKTVTAQNNPPDVVFCSGTIEHPLVKIEFEDNPF